MRNAVLLLLALLALAPTALYAQADGEMVDVELVMAVDVSESMSPLELEIQRRGYAEAIVSDEVMTAIRLGFTGQVAVAYVEWARPEDIRVVAGWSIIRNRQDAALFAAQLQTKFTATLRRTSISAALDFSAGLFDNNGYRGLRRVIDISGDGPNNLGRAVTLARDEALAKGIVINGLPLITREARDREWYLADLDQYYVNCVVGGPGSFVLPVYGWDRFGAAVQRKLVLELAGIKPRWPAVASTGAGRGGLHHNAAVFGASGGEYDCLIGEKIWRRIAKPVR